MRPVRRFFLSDKIKNSYQNQTILEALSIFPMKSFFSIQIYNTPHHPYHP